ncbi:ABC transporter permease [Pseudonocardia sp.]|uniref:ABC transporter permease n=1 Tax=Pseudonocardia sp. TaxID=60912 RepID=UPI00260EF986|nr:ABC transporter permease [Pseudonocardia sp.]
MSGRGVLPGSRRADLARRAVPAAWTAARREVQAVPVRRGVLARLLAHRTGRAGLALAAVLLLAVLAGPLLVGQSTTELDLGDKLAPPGPEHWLGTDQFGRDQLARLLEGGRRSLGAAALVLAGALVISMTIGIAAGLAGPVVDAVAMRVVDVLLALPGLILALAVVGVLGPSFSNLVLALVISSWAYYARLARSYVLAARSRGDVLAARMAGIPGPRIVAGHIVPGVATQLLVVATLDLGGVIVAIAGLSFLGLGVQPPDAEWGAMLSETRLYFTTAPWLLAGPAVATFLAVTAANLVGDALRDVAGPDAGGRL